MCCDFWGAISRFRTGGIHLCLFYPEFYSVLKSWTNVSMKKECEFELKWLNDCRERILNNDLICVELRGYYKIKRWRSSSSFEWSYDDGKNTYVWV